ncbi:hypothetical protein CYMTET_49745 [Cymbomonas tetramitiformis]|uniref:Uncharacterized protein n=1 Tax=Cymbomonas tetramitiformis TaxID=36881 RepID=A0AAE0ETJ9_9CHLO|nr:hypothetical protein CYMTET_49745 [Cymbomonas tetramitiformis]
MQPMGEVKRVAGGDRRTAGGAGPLPQGEVEAAERASQGTSGGAAERESNAGEEAGSRRSSGAAGARATSRHVDLDGPNAVPLAEAALVRYQWQLLSIRDERSGSEPVARFLEFPASAFRHAFGHVQLAMLQALVSRLPAALAGAGHTGRRAEEALGQQRGGETASCRGPVAAMEQLVALTESFLRDRDRVTRIQRHAESAQITLKQVQVDIASMQGDESAFTGGMRGAAPRGAARAVHGLLGGLAPPLSACTLCKGLRPSELRVTGLLAGRLRVTGLLAGRLRVTGLLAGRLRAARLAGNIRHHPSERREFSAARAAEAVASHTALLPRINHALHAVLKCILPAQAELELELELEDAERRGCGDRAGGCHTDPHEDTAGKGSTMALRRDVSITKCAFAR